MPATEAPVGSALSPVSTQRSFYVRPGSLLVHPPTMIPCLSGGPRLLLGLPQLWHTTLWSPQAVFTQPTPISPWGLTSKAWAAVPSAHLHWQSSGQASEAGECSSALTFCVGLSPFHPPHTCSCVLLWGSEVHPFPIPDSEGTCSLCGNLSSFIAPSQRARSYPGSSLSLSLSFSFFFYPTQLCEDFLALLEIWSLLPAFSRCSVRVVPHVDVFLMYLWGEGELHILLLHHLDLSTI